MSLGKREARNYTSQKINTAKVTFVIVLISVVIIGIILLIKNVNKNDMVERKEELEGTTLSEESVEKTIDDVVQEFGGEVKEKVKSDTYYVTKDEKEYTVYEDGQIVEGRVVMWDGSSQKPAIDEARKY